MYSFTAQPKQTLSQIQPRRTHLFKKDSDVQILAPTAIEPKRYLAFGGQNMTNGWQKIKEPKKYFKENELEEPLYVSLPQKIDKFTQIEQKDWLLFDFQNEVEPILEILVAKIISQSQVEVLSEKEVALNLQKKRELQRQKAAELANTQRVVDKALRYQNELKSRTRQRHLIIEKLGAVHSKLCARLFAKNCFIQGIISKFSLSSETRKDSLDLHLQTEKLVHFEFIKETENDLNSKHNKLQKINRLIDHLVSSLSNQHAKVILKNQTSFVTHEENKETKRLQLEIKLKEFEDLREIVFKLRHQTKQYHSFKKLYKTSVSRLSKEELMLQPLLSSTSFNYSGSTVGIYIGTQFEPIYYCLAIIIMNTALFNEILPICINAFLKIPFSVFKIPISEECNAEWAQLIHFKTENKNNLVSQNETIEILSKRCSAFLLENFENPFKILSSVHLEFFFKLILTSKLNKIKTDPAFIKQQSESPVKSPQIKNQDTNFEQEIFELKNIFKIEFLVCSSSLKESAKTKKFPILIIQKLLSNSPLNDLPKSDLLDWQKNKKLNRFDGKNYSQKAKIFKHVFSESFPVLKNSEGNPFIINKIAEENFIDKIMESLSNVLVVVPTCKKQLLEINENHIFEFTEKSSFTEKAIFELEC